MRGPLEGIRVLELTTVLMGPYCGAMIADLGADVIKVEEPGGEVGRQIGPSPVEGMGAIFIGLNRKKQSIALDLKSRPGIEIFAKLLAKADVFISNVRPEALARLGISYEMASDLNPEIVYCTLTGFGTDGPYVGRPAFDDLIQAAVGIPSLVADSTGGEPRYVPVNMMDRTVGLHAAFCICAALYHRERTGSGQHVQVPMFETMAAYVLSDHLYGRSFDPPLGQAGYSRLMSNHRRPYRTRDGYICAVIYTDQQWRRFFTLAGRPGAQDDPRFASIGARTRNIDQVLATLSEILADRTTAEWMRDLVAIDIPCSPVNSIDDLIDDPHLNAVGMIEEIDHPQLGKVKATNVPSKWSTCQPQSTREVAVLGEHASEILLGLGYDEREIAAFVASGAIPA